MLRGLPQPESIEPTPPGVLNIFGGSDPVFIQGLFNTNPTTLGLEFMKHGDVWKLLQRAGSHPKTWRSQELWFIWHCRESFGHHSLIRSSSAVSDSDSVFRGCVALAYPDRWSGGRNPLRDDIVLQEETIPLVNGQAANHDGALVHFDLEPQNGEFMDYQVRISNVAYRDQ